MEIWVALEVPNGTTQQDKVPVQPDATFADIKTAVVNRYNVAESRRPGSNDAVFVVVTGGGAAAGSAPMAERHIGKSCIAPKPIIMTQDTEAHNETECLSELIDNSIRAAAKNITVEASARGSNSEVTALTCEDDGVGMTHDNATNFMRLAHTDSGIVTGVREHGKPLALQQYFSEQLSRHGKGALALLSFGSKITTTTKRREAVVARKVVVDYEEWLQEFATTNNCQYSVDLFDVCDLTGEDFSYTHILIEKLKKDATEQFTDSNKVVAMTTQLADTYHFFLHGLDERLWNSAPAELCPSQGPAAAKGRPAGGVSIRFFGYDIGRNIPAGAQQPQLALMLNKFFELQSVHGSALKPFWLPIRWVDPEGSLKVEDVPTNVTTMGAFAASGGADGSGPAGRLRNVHRDFLLLLLYFPMQNGKRTKPEELLIGGSELCLFPVWSGRLIPDASYMARLPALVAEATRSGMGSYKLVSSRLCGILFCSPECYTTNHKTSFQEPAFQRALECGSSSSSATGELFVWDTHTQRFAHHHCAAQMLQTHFEQNWAKLERDGHLVGGTKDPTSGVYSSREYKLADRRDHIIAGQLVRVRTEEEKQAAADLARSGARSFGPTAEAILAAAGGGAGGKVRGRSRAGAARQPDVPALLLTAMPMHYRMVLSFEELGPDSGTQHRVRLQEWTPSWCPNGYNSKLDYEEVAVISVLAASNAETEQVQAALEHIWEAHAPHHLAWYDNAAAGQDKVVVRAQDLSSVPSASSFAPTQVPERLTACLATQHGALANLEGNKWNSRSMNLRASFTITFSLERNRQHIRQWSCKYTQKQKGAVLEGLRQAAQQPGEYTLTVTAPNSWVKEPLTYSFKVAAAVPETLRAAWVAGSDDTRPVALGQRLPALEITARNAAGEDVALPLPSDDSSIASMCTVTLQARDPSVRNFTVKTADVRPFTNDKREAVFIDGWSAAKQDLKLPKGQSKVFVEVHVKLKLETGDVLELDAGSRPSLYLASGPPAKAQPDIDSSEADPLLSTRGTTVNLSTILVLDEKSNAVDMDNRSYCACVTFDPPNAIQLPSGDGLNGAVALGPGAVADSAPPAASSSSRRRAGRRSMSAAGVAYAFPCKLDGNAVDFKNTGLKWRLAPGERAKATIRVYKGQGLAAALARTNPAPVVQHVYHFRMHNMQTQLQHQWIEDLESSYAAVAARRRPRRARGPREAAAEAAETPEFSGEAYELNTFENCPTEILVAYTAESTLSDAITRRLVKGYERRRHILAGTAVDVYITPKGDMLWTGTAHAWEAVTRTLPASLARHWNSLPKEPNNPNRVLDVAFVLPHDKLQLEGVEMQFFREDDAYDDDFYGAVKVVCKEADVQLLPGVELLIQQGILRLPPVTLQRCWFTQQRRGTITLRLLDVEDQQQHQAEGEQQEGAEQQQQQSAPLKELGKFYVRLAPYAEQLCLLPAGKLFEGTVVSARFGTDYSTAPEKRRLLRQELPQATSSAASSSSSSLGAWSPWKTDKQLEPQPRSTTPVSRQAAQAARSAATASQSVEAVQHWGVAVHSPLVVRLGEPLVLHFVATDLARCPVAVTADQTAWVEQHGLQVEAGSPGVHMAVEAVAWSWAASHPGRQQQQQPPPGHLGGLLVNAVTCKLLTGCGPAQLKLVLQGSAAEPTVLQLDLMVEAGPVAVDGLWLRQVTMQQQQQVAAPDAAAAAVQVFPLHGGILADRHTWEFMPEVKVEPGEQQGWSAGEAAAEDEEEQEEDEDMEDVPLVPPAHHVPPAYIKPDPEQAVQQQQQQQPQQQQQQPQQQQNRAVEYVELLDSDSDDEVAIVGHLPVQQEQQQQPSAPAPQQQQVPAPMPHQHQPQPPPQQQQAAAQQRRRIPRPRQSARARQLAQLSPAAAAVLNHLNLVVEGSTVKLCVQLVDDARQEISADTPAGVKLRLLHHRGWQQPSQQQQQQACQVDEVQTASITKGKAELQFSIGVGDAWLGPQLFEIQPLVPAAAASAGAAAELRRVLPILLLLQVTAGNFPGKLQLQTDLAAGGAFLASAADAAAALLQQASSTDVIEASLRNCKLRNVAPAEAAAAGGADVLTLQLHDEQDTAAAAAGGWAAAAERHVGAVLPGFDVVITSRNRRPLAPASLQQLQLQLHKWRLPLQQGAAAAAAGHSAAAGFTPESCWQLVPGSCAQVSAEVAYPAAAAAAAVDGPAAAVLGDAVTVYRVAAGGLTLPNAVGLYKITATYGTQFGRAANLTAVSPLHIGPFLLLPASPSRLVPSSALRQQQQQQSVASAAASPARPRSAGRRGKGPTSRADAATTAAAAAAGSAHVPVQVVLQAKVAETRYPGEQLYLQDVWGNPWRAAAASLAAAAAVQGAEQQQQQPASPGSVLSTPLRNFLHAIMDEPDSQERQAGPPAKRQRLADGSAAAVGPAAAAGEDQWRLQLLLVKDSHGSSSSGGSSMPTHQQQQQDRAAVHQLALLPFDAEGCCTIPPALLSDLGITAAGDYRLEAVAVVQSTTDSSSSYGGPFSRQLPAVLLAQYRVAAADSYELESQKTQLRNRVSGLRAAVHHHRQRVAQLQEQQQQSSSKLGEAQQLLGQAQGAKDHYRQLLQGYGHLVEHAPAQLLPRWATPNSPQLQQQPTAHPRHVLLQPRVQGQEPQQAAPAPQAAVNELLGGHLAHEVQRLVDQGHVLGPVVSLGAAERLDIARAVAGLLGQHLLKLLVCTSRAGEAALHRRLLHYNLHTPEAPSYFTYLPHLHAPPHERQHQLQLQLRGAPREAAWMWHHPQQLVPPSAWLQAKLRGTLCWHAYTPAEGFLGFAINLLHLTREQLAYTVQVSAVPRQQGQDWKLVYDGRVQQPLQLGLRHTLWASKLSNVLVFERDEHIQAFRQRMQAADNTRGRPLNGIKLISLDGGTYGLSGLEGGTSLRTPAAGGLLFSGLAQSEVLPQDGATAAAAAGAGGGPLDLRLRYLMDVKVQLHRAEQEVGQLRQQSQNGQQQQQKLDNELQAAQRELQAAQQEEAGQLPAIEAQLQRVEVELRHLGSW